MSAGLEDFTQGRLISPIRSGRQTETFQFRILPIVVDDTLEGGSNKVMRFIND